MTLKNYFEHSGNKLFRTRSYVPVIFFIVAVPAIYFTGNPEITHKNYVIITLLAVMISLLGMLIRAYTVGTTPVGTSGRNTDKQVAMSLNTKGIYSLIRHPLYLGNYLIWLGPLVFTFNLYFVIIISLTFWLYYERIMYAEEAFLEGKFGKQFRDWTDKIPAIIPNFKTYSPPSVSLSIKSVLRREYSGLLAMSISFVFIDILRYYFVNHSFVFNRTSIYLFIIVTIIVLIIRSVKHYTSFLNEEGRS